MTEWVSKRGKYIHHETCDAGPDAPCTCPPPYPKPKPPRARHTDPETSHAAAGSVRQSDNQRAVKAVLRMIGSPTLDEDLVREYMARYKAMRLPQQSESGIRSRRSELSRAGELVEGEKKRMTTGRLGRTWSIAEQGGEP